MVGGYDGGRCLVAFTGTDHQISKCVKSNSGFMLNKGLQIRKGNKLESFLGFDLLNTEI